MTLCFLIPAIVGLICGILGYLIGKTIPINLNTNDLDSLKDDLDSCNRRNSQLRFDIENIRKNNKANSPNTQKDSFISDGPTLLEITPFNVDAFKLIFGKKIKENDLKIVEGIGPKIEELFKTSDILTWKSLSETSENRLKMILNKAGERYKIHDPSTWPKQSKLAYEGKWEELKDWQEILDGGKER
jgi:predicted flap endonuclease-1-like 5' DNA nuclease